MLEGLPPGIALGLKVTLVIGGIFVAIYLLGMIIQMLERKGLIERAYILLTSDAPDMGEVGEVLTKLNGQPTSEEIRTLVERLVDLRMRLLAKGRVVCGP